MAHISRRAVGPGPELIFLFLVRALTRFSRALPHPGRVYSGVWLPVLGEIGRKGGPCAEQSANWREPGIEKIDSGPLVRPEMARGEGLTRFSAGFRGSNDRGGSLDATDRRIAGRCGLLLSLDNKIQCQGRA